MSGMTDLERLIEVDAIRQLIGRRIRALDTKDWATYEALHAPDYRANNEGERPWVGSKANTARLAELQKDKVSVHHVHSAEINILSPTTANGVWAMEDRIYWKQGDEDHWLHGFGFYYETYEKRDGQWVFTTRQLKRQKVLSSPGATIGDFSAPRK
jgi:hypothetical protein